MAHRFVGRFEKLVSDAASAEAHHVCINDHQACRWMWSRKLGSSTRRRVTAPRRHSERTNSQQANGLPSMTSAAAAARSIAAFAERCALGHLRFARFLEKRLI